MQESKKPNPLIFIPSPRDIPDVVKHWLEYKYDMLCVKYKPERVAYEEGLKFFKEHKEYTHFIICPDDCEIPFKDMEKLLTELEKNNFDTISGFANLEEQSPDMFAIQDIGKQDYNDDRPDVTYGAWWLREDLPNKKRFEEIGLATFACQVIKRHVLMNMEWYLNHIFDWQFSKYCYKNGIKLWVDTTVEFYHRRKEQFEVPKLFITQGFPKGYTVWKKYKDH